MSKLTLRVDVSLDMYIADVNGSKAWINQKDLSAFNAFYDKQDVLIMGRKTFEKLLGELYWPYQHKEVIVLSGMDIDQPTPMGVTVYSGELIPLLDMLKKKHENIWLVGGGLTARTFLETGLLDEMVLTIHPILLGDGVPLFLKGNTKQLEMCESKTFDNGSIEVVYRLK